jgi:hypothetical protein
MGLSMRVLLPLALLLLIAPPALADRASAERYVRCL